MKHGETIIHGPKEPSEGNSPFFSFLFFLKKRKKKGKGTKGKLPIRNRVKEHFRKTAFIEIQNLTGFTIH
jgi:hypothetical protein